MANEYVNKVVLGSSTLIDLTADTVTPQTLYLGTTAHDASGAAIVGTMSGGGTEAGTVTQDAQGYLVLDDEAPSGRVTVEALSVTQNGTYTAPTGKAYSPVTVSVSGGGGGGGNMSDPIRFFDYDGTLVASYPSVPASLPDVPTHTGLTNGVWNYTLSQVTTQFNAMGTCDVGANYDTASGATEIDIELKEGRLHPSLSLAVNGTVTVDWGDGSTPDTATGTSLSYTLTNIHHEYAAAGSYTIKISKTSGTGYSLYCSTTLFLLSNYANNSSGNTNLVYSSCVREVRVGADCAIGNNAFRSCYLLTAVSVPSGVTSIGNNAFYNCYSLVSLTVPSEVTSLSSMFYYCYSLMSVSVPSSVTSIGGSFQYCEALRSVSIPSGVTSIGNNMFIGCSSLLSVKIPNNVTSIGSTAFSGCDALASLTIPSGVTSIGTSAFQSSSILASLTIPSSVTSIGNSAFRNCYGMAEYHVKPTVPPTLGTTAFGNIPTDCKIYVPAASLTDYQAAENWSTYASYMVGE